MRVYHKCFSKIYKQLIWMQYYLLTITLACTYHISYSSTNALYYTEMLSPLETVNTAFAIFLLMGTVAVVISIWGLSNQ